MNEMDMIAVARKYFTTAEFDGNITPAGGLYHAVLLATMQKYYVGEILFL